MSETPEPVNQDTRSAPLWITAEVTEALARLSAQAARMPVDVQRLKDKLGTAQGKRLHREAMNKQTVVIPGKWPFFVTLSVETGHPVGTALHMSMSIKREARVPSPEAIWMVAELLGFTGDGAGTLEQCGVWVEDLTDGGKAVNVVQPVVILPVGATARQ